MPGRPKKRNPLPAKRFGYTQKVKIGSHSIFLRTGSTRTAASGRSSSTCTRRVRRSAACSTASRSPSRRPAVRRAARGIRGRLHFTRFEPNGIVSGHDNIKMSTSVLDFIFATWRCRTSDGPTSCRCGPTTSSPRTRTPTGRARDERERQRRARARGQRRARGADEGYEGDRARLRQLHLVRGAPACAARRAARPRVLVSQGARSPLVRRSISWPAGYPNGSPRRSSTRSPKCLPTAGGVRWIPVRSIPSSSGSHACGPHQGRPARSRPGSFLPPSLAVHEGSPRRDRARPDERHHERAGHEHLAPAVVGCSERHPGASTPTRPRRISARTARRSSPVPVDRGRCEDGTCDGAAHRGGSSTSPSGPMPARGRRPTWTGCSAARRVLPTASRRTRRSGAARPHALATGPSPVARAHRAHLRAPSPRSARSSRAFAAPIASSYGRRGRLRVHGVRAGPHAPGDRRLPRRLSAFARRSAPRLGRLLVTTLDTRACAGALRHRRRGPARCPGRGKPAGTHCPCGRTGGMVLEDIEGRASGITLARTAGRHQAAVDRAWPGSRARRPPAAADSPDILRVAYVLETAAGASRSADRAVHAALRRLYGRSCAIETREVPALSPERPAST